LAQVCGPDYARAAATARSLIRRMGYLPVSGQAVARFLRVPVIDVWSRCALPPDSGVTVYSPSGQGMRILVAAGPVSSPRLNWTIAHEVGHIALAHVPAVHSPSRLQIAALDAEAHACAAELLMPASVLQQLGARWTEMEVAWRCGVSLAAARCRLRQLRRSGGRDADLGGVGLAHLWGRRPPLRSRGPERRQTVADYWLLPGAPPVSDVAARAYLAVIREEEELRRLAADAAE
jgi:hypothetical protein